MKRKVVKGLSIALAVCMFGANMAPVAVAAKGYDKKVESQNNGKGYENKNDAAIIKKIKSKEMEVVIDKTFPRVLQYTMADGKVFYGQTEKINTIRINGVDVAVEPKNVKTKITNDTATYVMNVADKANNIDAVITAELVVEKNTLAFNITEIKNNLEDSVDGYPVQTIAIPNHSLISVRSSQNGANLKGAAMSSNTTISGDEYMEINAETELHDRDYMYAFISNDELSAGMWSNSENEGRGAAVSVYGGSHNTRIFATSEETDGVVSVGLASAPWYYHRVVESATKVNEDGSTYTKKYMVKETEMPKSKVIISGEQNDDGEISWQDGAVAFRSIMNNPYKCEEVPELVAWRIAMNFGGQAQNPFLTTLDNVKRVAMHTDGLGQSVLLKGYGSEGHDSGHPDYADIGTRIGGAEDMNFLMTNGAKYGARFGIHVNAGEMYPEAKAFSEDMVRRNADGGLRYGWNWIDQGVGIDSIYDLGEGLREARFDALEEKVGQNLDFVYVDIWGNRTGGSDDSWQTRKLSKEITDNGWRMATEWGSANEYDSTFQHWATDLTYGGYTLKGENSEVMRFLRNHQKDSWVGDYPAYGGAAIAPLLGGYNMKDFEGWQGRNDYDTYITNLYTHDLTTKFIQHYKVIKWVDGEAFTAKNSSGKVYTWTPEMEITLKDGEDTLVLTRGSNDPTDAAYRDRTMTLNGKVIATGAASSGDRSNSDIQNGKRKGTEKYLLPWIWDAETGEKVASEDEKLYHWNTQGGTSEWELPDSWKDLEDVKVYKLTDLGKTGETTVAVVDGKITLTAESEIPYVVCKGERGNLDITWSEGMHIVDAGFNSGNFDAWTKAGKGTAEIAKSQYSNPMMKLTGEVAMSQTLTDLKAGQQYAVLVGVDNRSDAKAAIEIKAGDKVLASNYTKKSIAKNYVKAYTHSNSSATVDGTSYFQNMYVFFTAPESGDVTLTLSREAGEGAAYFDDVRITENESKNITTDENGNIVKFEQNFETNVQGIYPFVIGVVEGVEDNRTHLSEKHAPFTQAGWDVKKMDDVLEGTWSVKTNGLCQGSDLLYQTIPQNFRFEPGVTYKVSFDYQSGSNDIYAFAVGNGDYEESEGNFKLTKLRKALGTTGHYSDIVTGSEDGQTWFGIYSTDAAPDLQGTSGAAANFGGYKDFVLDNLVIERIEVDTTVLEELVARVNEEYNKTDYTAKSWEGVTEALARAEEVINSENPTEEEIMEAYDAVKAALAKLVILDPEAARDIPVEGMKATAGSAEPNGGASEGPASNVLDGEAGTIWHTVWAGTALNNMWLDIELKEAATVGGVRIQSRSGNNGVINTADIYVKTAGSDVYERVAENANFGSGWTKVTFKNVADVTNVKIQPTATSGDTPNKWASAAEVRIMGPEVEE